MVLKGFAWISLAQFLALQLSSTIHFRILLVLIAVSGGIVALIVCIVFAVVSAWARQNPF